MKSDLKELIFSLIALTVIIFSGMSIKSYLYRTTQTLLEEIEKAESYVNNDRWDDAHKAILDLSQRWDSTEKKWALFTNHHEIDNITISIRTSSEYIKAKQKSEALASISTLKHYVSHIPKMEDVSFENIF